MRAALVLFLLAGCQPLNEPAPSLALDREYFRCHVQPILTESCAQLGCHGDYRRAFHVYARNRLRLSDDETQRNALLSADELEFDYRAASRFVDAVDPARSLLLLKPLEPSAGGYFHVGETRFDQGNVYLGRDDPQFVTLEAWALGAVEPTPCP